MRGRAGVANGKAGQDQAGSDLAQAARPEPADQSKPPGTPQIENVPDGGGLAERGALSPRERVERGRAQDYRRQSTGQAAVSTWQQQCVGR